MIELILVVCSILLTAGAAWFALRLQVALRRFRIRKQYTAAIEAPSVSVCIPARNETHAMTECIQAVLASDYKKMEILVFDDDSGDDTSALVRSFAYAGVRFVSGATLPEGWLGKNHALDTLAREASGTYVLFMDVDTRITPTTINWLVGYMMTEKLEMASVIPMRKDIWRVSTLLGSLRYFWQLVLWRQSAPAAAGTFWAVRRQTLLENLGGFAAFKGEVLPESHMASLLGTTYHCLISNSTLGVTFEKKWSSQRETSRRLLYPMVGGHWQGGLAGLCGLLLLNLPVVMIVVAGFLEWTLWQVMAAWLLVAYMAVYGMYLSHVWQRGWWLGGLLWPVVVLQELGFFVMSLYGYARGKVTWKGRSIGPIASARRSSEA